MVINGEVTHHVYVKLQPGICATRQGFLFTCRSGFIVHYFYTLISSFTQFFIHKNCFELFLSAHFLFIF